MVSNNFNQFDSLSSTNGTRNTLTGLQPSPEHHQPNHSILIIDDSNRICSLIVTGIVSSCVEVGYTCRITQSSDLGLLETLQMDFGHAKGGQINDPATTSSTHPIFMVYTANSPRNALPVLNQPGLTNLTIISDIMMPADTEVGLIGLLDEITRLKLPVNLLFTSSESQNREYVMALIKSGKAFFLEKGSDAWVDMPYALVQRTNSFTFKTIITSDYDNGFLRRRFQPTAPLSQEAIPSLGQRMIGSLKKLPGNLMRKLPGNLLK